MDELKPEWIVVKIEGFDLLTYARAMMESSIDVLTNDDFLVASALIITDENIHGIYVSYDGQDEKEQVYGEVVKYARRVKAIAIVTVNDSYVGEPDDVEDYYPGKLKEIGSKEAIMITISGPGIKSKVLRVMYERVKGRIRFGQVEEEDGITIGLLHDWADNIKSVN